MLSYGETLREMYDERVPLLQKYADITVSWLGTDFVSETVVGKVIDALPGKARGPCWIFFCSTPLWKRQVYSVSAGKGRDRNNTTVYRKNSLKKKGPPHAAAHRGVRVRWTKPGPLRGSVVILVFVVHFRPQVLVIGRGPEIIFNGRRSRRGSSSRFLSPHRSAFRPRSPCWSGASLPRFAARRRLPLLILVTTPQGFCKKN